MRAVEGPDGERLLVRKASGDSLLVVDPETGEERYVAWSEVSDLGDQSTLDVAAGAVPSATRRVLSAVHGDESLGLLLEIVDRGPIAVLDLLGAYDLCESDLHGLLGEFRAAGLVDEARVAGERGYDATDLARDGVAHLRDRDPGSADPGTDDSGSADPGTDDSGSADPGTDDSGSADQGSDDSGSDDPGIDDPGTDDHENAVADDHEDARVGDDGRENDVVEDED